MNITLIISLESCGERHSFYFRSVCEYLSSALHNCSSNLFALVVLFSSQISAIGLDSSSSFILTLFPLSFPQDVDILGNCFSSLRALTFFIFCIFLALSLAARCSSVCPESITNHTTELPLQLSWLFGRVSPLHLL